MQEMFKKGVLILNTHNVSMALSEGITDELLEKYESVLILLAENISENTLHENLQVEPLAPLFKIR